MQSLHAKKYHSLLEKLNILCKVYICKTESWSAIWGKERENAIHAKGKGEQFLLFAWLSLPSSAFAAQHMQKWGSLVGGKEAPEEGLLLRFLFRCVEDMVKETLQQWTHSGGLFDLLSRRIKPCLGEKVFSSCFCQSLAAFMERILYIPDEALLLVHVFLPSHWN